MTVVKRFKNQLKDIADLTNCRMVGLNSAQPKYNRFSGNHSAGVKSDHIRIFYTDENHSFAFAFDYSNNPENPIFTVSTKENGNIVSADFREPEFREKINVLVFVLKKESAHLSKDQILQLVFDIFLKDSDPNDRFKQEIESVTQIFSKAIVEFMAKESKYTLRRKRVQSDLEKYTAEIDSKIKDLKKDLGFEEIEKKYKEAVSQIKKTQDKLELKLNIDELKKERNNLDKKLRENGFEKRGFFQSNLKKLPQSVSKVISQKFEKEIKGN